VLCADTCFLFSLYRRDVHSEEESRRLIGNRFSPHPFSTQSTGVWECAASSRISGTDGRRWCRKEAKRFRDRPCGRKVVSEWSLVGRPGGWSDPDF